MTNVSVASNGTFTNNVYSWKDNTNNLLEFKDLTPNDGTTDLSEYDKIVIPVSNWSTGAIRCVIRVKTGEGHTDYTCVMSDYNSSSEPVEKKLSLLDGDFKDGSSNKITKDMLRKVIRVYFGGSTGGSAESKPSVTLGQVYLTKQLTWDDNGEVTILPQDFNCGDNVTRNDNSFTFKTLYSTLSIDFEGDGISASKLNVATPNITDSDFSIFYSKNDKHEDDKMTTSALGGANVIRIKYAYQKDGQKNVTIDNIKLTYNSTINVTLNANGGKINGVESKTIKYCDTPIKLPAATPNDQNYVFNAWRNGGSHCGNAGDDYTPTGNVTLTAHYTNKTLWGTNNDQLGDDTKTVPMNTVFTPRYEISKNTQKEFTFTCNRPLSLDAFWYGWVMWAKPSSATGNVNDKPFYFWTNAQDTRIATDANTGIWDKSISSDIKISKDGKLYDMTEDERNTYRSDMANNAKVNVKVAYFDNTIRMYAVIKSSDESRIYVQAYTYNNTSYIKDAQSIDVYFSVDHAYLTNFTANNAISLVTATGMISSGAGTVKIYTQEGYDIHNPAKVGKDEYVVFEAIPNSGYKFTKWSSGDTDNPRLVKMDTDRDPHATFVTGLETIIVDGNIREYGIYVPGNVKNKQNVPVIFSLHGRQGNGADPDKTDAPRFKDVADKEGVIIVYPQGRKAGDKQSNGSPYPNRTENGQDVNWDSGYAGVYGWEATGKENADTKFIQALVKEIQTKYASQNSSNGNISVDPKRFYLCGFSMGGMMTYACAKVLNGTFAAYGSCGGFPLNEFHLNLATKQPVPFIHLHGNSDNVVGINHLHTIIENLLFRNGCSLAGFNTTDAWTATTENGEKHQFKRYDFTGENGVPVTTVTFNGLGHEVESSAPNYLWNFFNGKTLDTYQPTTMKWQWDMTTINENLGDVNGNHYGWNRVQIAGGNNGTLTYGDNRKNNDNQNVYNSIQLEKGTYKLHAKANVAESDGTGIIVGIYKVVEPNDPEECIVRRQVKNNSGDASANLSILCPFTVTEDGEYYIKIERGNSGTTCTALAIHTSDYNPDDVDDSENYMELPKDWETTGRIVKIDFEKSNVGDNCENIGEEQEVNDYYLFNGVTPTDDSYKLYNRHKGDNKQNWAIKDVILHDAVFGNYFQNIPKAQFYDRSGNMNYMRAVLKKEALKPIQTTGEATIGFWVNGRVAVDAGLSYNDASMLYLSSPWRHPATVDGEPANHREHQSMFNIRCNGNTNGFLNKVDGNQIRYYAHNMFGDLCDNENAGTYYKKNLYLDRNWHYVTMVMYNDLRNVDMYVDGELTNSRKNIVGGDQNLTAGLDSINHIIIGGLNATYTNFGYDPAFAFDDIVIYSRALSSQEINQIISDKEYSPNSWDFEKDIANEALLNVKKLDESLWTYDKSKNVYTLNIQLSNEAELTYDGIRVIPAFRGLKFVTGAEKQIQIDMANKRLKVIGYKGSNGNAATNPTVMKISNAPADQYLRYEFDNKNNVWLDIWEKQPFQGDITISNSKTVITKVATPPSGEERQICTCNVNDTISFKSIGSTDKVYADLCFGTSSGETNINRVSKVDFSSINQDVTQYNNYPQLLLIENGTYYGNKINFQDLKDSKYSGKIKFWSSAPHVAYIEKVENNQPTVKATGIPGSAYIYAELENDNEYDCNNENAGLYESSSRIIARYEIHVPNKETGYSVKISKEPSEKSFKVGDVLSTTDKAVTLTLGGWNYKYNDSFDYFGKTDGYTKKEEWKGMPLKKTENDTNGCNSKYDTTEGAATTDGDTYSALSSYTGGTYAASSEQMDGNEDKGLFSTTVINNSTAWTLPCRGSYAKIEPTEAGIISVYVLQEGCMERNLTGVKKTFFNGYPEIAPNEPYDISIKKVYVADEAGQVIEDVVTDTKSKIVSQVWKDDGRARAEYSFHVKNTAYSELLHDRFKKNIVEESGDDYTVILLDQWNSPGMTQNIIKFGKGFGIVDKGIVRYTFNVLPGKTYYVFSNDAKIGIAGFNFTKDKQLNFNDHKIVATDPVAAGPSQATLSFDDKFSRENDKQSLTLSENKNVKLTYNREFKANTWSSICLPYSISNRQMNEQFGEGTQVVLLNKIYDKDGHGIIQFIWHANQDIIAGYPYLILPTKTTYKIETNSAILKTSPLFSVSEYQQTYDSGQTLPNGYVFKGNFEEEEIPVGSYVLNTSGQLGRVGVPELKLKPFRAYLCNNYTNPLNAKILKSMAFSAWDDLDDESGTTTSIDVILEDSGIFTKGADVYDLNGVLVRKNAHTIQGLPKGIYVVNGKKYVVK